MIVLVGFGDEVFVIGCTELLSSSFYANALLDERADIIVLGNPNAKCDGVTKDVLAMMLESNFLVREVFKETESGYDVTYHFNEELQNALQHVNESILIDILVLLDSLDIKPYIVSLMEYLNSIRGVAMESILKDCRARRIDAVTVAGLSKPKT